MKKILFLVPCSLFIFGGFSANAATVATRANQRTQSVLDAGTKVRDRVVSDTLYSADCYNEYFGCMDSFCKLDNDSGGTCQCSDENAQWAQIRADNIKKVADARALSDIEVERIGYGANADIMFSGGRQYDAQGNVIQSGAKDPAAEKAKKRTDLLSMWNRTATDIDPFSEASDDFSNKTGVALYNAVRDMCISRVSDKCKTDLPVLTQLYGAQIKSDCLAFKNLVTAEQITVNDELATAQKSVRDARAKKFATDNKYDLGACLVNYKECMQGDDACGKDWINCVSVTADLKATDSVGTGKTTMRNNRVAIGGRQNANDPFSISPDTQNMLDRKRTICDNVLDKCMAVRDMVWPAFLKEAAPDLKAAELRAESTQRRGCLTRVTDCIVAACRVQDMGHSGEMTMESCLAYPETVRDGQCKIEFDSCEKTVPSLWSYIQDKLAAMRVDACVDSVRTCFTSPNNCGPKFENCIGIDFAHMHQFCPEETLIACKGGADHVDWDRVNQLIMGLYLSMDNSALDNCQNVIDSAMIRACGSATDCNVFASDDTIGTNSLRPQKVGDIYRITGMISFGSIKVGGINTGVTDALSAKEGKDGGVIVLRPGEIGVQDYIYSMRAKNADVKDREAIFQNIESELNSIAGRVNQVINIVEQDPKVQYCITGRSMEQITGQDEMTKGRFPHLLDQTKILIAQNALMRANANYNRKLNAAIAEASANATLDMQQFMCQKMADIGPTAANAMIGPSSTLTTPFQISYDIGAGLDMDKLTKGGRGTEQMQYAHMSGSIYAIGGGKSESEISMTRSATAVFNRANGTCHLCTDTVVPGACTNEKKNVFWGLSSSNKNNCDKPDLVSKCEDIQMGSGAVTPSAPTPAPAPETNHFKEIAIKQHNEKLDEQGSN